MKPAAVRFVAGRWFAPGREAGPSLRPAIAGIAAGVAALLCVIGVMNGFQGEYIDAVLSLDSYHVRIIGQAGVDVDAVRRAIPDAAAVVPFIDTSTLAVNTRGSSTPARIKILDDRMETLDPEFIERLGMRSGSFGGGIVVGSELARRLDLRVGDELRLLAVSADPDSGVEASMEGVRVSGVYHSGFYDFDAGLAFISSSAAGRFEDGEPRSIGVKLADRYGDLEAVSALERVGISGAQSWRDYNRSFFGALRMEKSVMMTLIGLIFLVVGVNIFHSMRKTVHSRIDDIATLKAIGADSRAVRRVFILNGAVAGAAGALIGLCVGLLVSTNVNAIFDGVEAASSFVFSSLGQSGKALRFFSPEYFYVGDVPVRLPFAETLFIASAGAVSALAAAWAASARVSTILPSEVLRDE